MEAVLESEPVSPPDRGCEESVVGVEQSRILEPTIDKGENQLANECGCVPH